MRAVARTALAVAAATLSACGGSGGDSAGEGTTEIPRIGGPSDSPTVAPTAGASNEVAVRSTLKDADAYAVQLEQVFFNDGYPQDLAEVLPIAAKLDLELAPGNRIASYQYDPDAQEFKLCVENSSGAFAIYDTQPMSTLQSGASGGCPAP